MARLTWLSVMIASAGTLVLLSSLPARSDEDKATELVKAAKITIDQAIKTASEKVQGTVIEAELEKKHDKVVWEVEVVGEDGKVSEIHVDADSGAVIDVEEKKAKGEKKKKK